MPTKVIMPQMGESIAEGTVVKWLKKVGERVERDEPLFEISTDKVDAEIPSPASGVLTKILVKENETVEVNAVVAELDGESTGAYPPAGKEKVSAAKAGPAAVPPPASAAATPLQIAPRESAAAPAVHHEGEKIRSSPLVRRIARENNVDLAHVAGTGQGGRISKRDILGYVAHSPASSGGAAASGARAAEPKAPAMPRMVFTGPTEVVPMTPMRRQIAEHMMASQSTSAHVAAVFEVEMTKVADLRAQQAAEFEKRHGLKLTYTSFFVRAAVETLKEFPIFNASIEGTNIVYKRDINIGVAVTVETGLIVPVIKQAGEKSFSGIARAIQDLAERARSKKLSVDDVQGGTFTITNPGVFGSLFGIPLINQPQVAILGAGGIEKRAVVRHDAIAIRPMVYLSLSFDHRIIDGALANQFMGRLKDYLENWNEAVL